MYQCPACGHKEEYLIGVGFTNPAYRENARERILAGDYGPESKAAFEATPILAMAIDVEWALYQMSHLFHGGKPGKGCFRFPCPEDQEPPILRLWEENAPF